MRTCHYVGSLLIVALSQSVAFGGSLRLWFEVMRQGPLAQGDPSVTGEATLFLWANALEETRFSPWRYVGFNIDIDGPALIEQVIWYNAEFEREGETYYRWTTRLVGQPPPPAEEIEDNYLSAIPAYFTYGITNPARRDTIVDPPLGIPGYDAPTQSVLLGEIHVRHLGGTPALLFLEVGSHHAIEQADSPPQPVYFGFGDAPVMGNAFGQRSELPEATILPEPAGAAALGALLAIVLRRCRSPRC